MIINVASLFYYRHYLAPFTAQASIFPSDLGTAIRQLTLLALLKDRLPRRSQRLVQVSPLGVDTLTR